MCLATVFYRRHRQLDPDGPGGRQPDTKAQEPPGKRKRNAAHGDRPLAIRPHGLRGAHMSQYLSAFHELMPQPRSAIDQWLPGPDPGARDIQFAERTQHGWRRVAYDKRVRENGGRMVGFKLSLFFFNF